MKYSLSLALIALAPAALWAQTPTGAAAAPARSGDARVPPVAGAVRTQAAPSIDGRLDDAAWAQAPVISTFRQRDPNEGEPVSEATEVRIVYDDEAIYIGARLHDRSPVTQRLGRRDMATSSSDWLRVSLDSYHDRRTAFRFDVNPAGVRRDATISGGSGDGDLAWDAVWDAATSVESGGWTAEMRIPFSQLRFAPAEEQTWGLQLERVIDRTQELALFSYTPKSEQGGVPSFGDLTGLRGIRPGRPLELIPYVLSQGRFAPTPSNPFVGDRAFQLNAGADARYRITSNLTLSATVNPDFGQVEVDPAVINLTAFETRFEEKRPFFVEGANSFKFGGTVGGPSAAAASLLYSRRLGRAPQIGIRADRQDAPSTTAILGAVKLSGKTANGWSLGVLDAITNEERGRYMDPQGVPQHALVEPRSNYFVGRVNRDLRRGRSTVGGIFTALNRDLAADTAAAALRSGAYTGGFDFLHEWANRTWSLSGFAVASQVQGSARSILLTQRASTRYLQRPDAEKLSLDPTATSMTGAAATIQLHKTAGLHWTTDTWLQLVSPGFEVNDVGFLQRADRRAFGNGANYTERSPGRVLRTWRWTGYVNYAQNFDGNTIDHFYWTQLNMTHLSYWTGSLYTQYEPERTDDRFTRGGPLALRPGVWTGRATLGTDPRKAFTGAADLTVTRDRVGSRSRALQTTVDIRTSPQWNLTLGPRFTRVDQDAQYVTAVGDPSMTATYGARYIFAPLKQTEASLVTRLNYTFSPNLSLELYAQPLISNGEYGTPKQFQTPAGYDFATYGTELGTLARNGNRFTVDPDGAGPLKPFTVPDRSFTTRSIRGNAVLRWEYRPGSTFYLVWQQDRLNPDLVDDFRVDRAVGTLFDTPANNIVVLKWSYWFNP